MNVHIAGAMVGGRPVPIFEIPDATSTEAGIRHAAQILAIMAPRGTEISVNGIGTDPADGPAAWAIFKANGMGGID
jgi:hypothetical protein